jgi:hypothetical protein
MIEKPPPLLSNCHVLEYAVVDDSVKYLGDSLHVFIGDTPGAVREVGAVPCLAVTRDLDNGAIRLLYCDQEWDLVATAGEYPTVEQAKSRAERVYQGISSRWTDTNVTEDAARKYRDEVWADHRCSFCDKMPIYFDTSFERNGVAICNFCIEELYKLLQEDPAKK